MDAGLPDRQLGAKMREWERHANDPRVAVRLKAAKVIMADRAAKGKADPHADETPVRGAGTPTAPVSKTETTAAKAEAPAAKPKPTRVSVPEPQGGGTPLKDAVERLRRARADKDAAPDAVAEADAAVEAARASDRPFDPPRPRPNAKAAAKVVGEFVAEDKTREALLEPYHDKESGMVVASDGRILIATKHGFDPNGLTGSIRSGSRSSRRTKTSRFVRRSTRPRSRRPAPRP